MLSDNYQVNLTAKRLRKRSNIIYAIYNVIYGANNSKSCSLDTSTRLLYCTLDDYIISVKAKERRYMMTGVTRDQSERAKVGLQLSSWYLQLTLVLVLGLIIVDDARIPSSEGIVMVIERHTSPLAVLNRCRLYSI